MTFTKPGSLSANPINLVWDNVEADNTNGTLAILTFTVPKESGKYNVSISYDEGGVIDGDLNPVNLNVVNGVIQVTEKSTVIGTGTSGKEVTWSLGDDGTLTISGTGDMKN